MTARLVHQRLRQRQLPRAPTPLPDPHHQHMVVQAQAFFSQVVAHARGPHLVGTSLKQSQNDQGLEPLGQSMARDTQARLPVVKALHANEGPQNERYCPAVTQQMQAVAECAGRQRIADEVKARLDADPDPYRKRANF